MTGNTRAGQAPKRLYRLPGGTTTDLDEYAGAWTALGKRAVRWFPGYQCVSADPNMVFEYREEYDYNGKTYYRVLDRFTLSVRAIELLNSTVMNEIERGPTARKI